MSQVTVQTFTTENPLQTIGLEAGVCWGADTKDKEKNIQRGKDCLASGHMRTAEYVQVYLVLDGYSARVMRELYTHIAGGPTRLQASTRYINYGDFDFIIPPSIEKDKDAAAAYLDAMNQIKVSFRELQNMNIPKEDIANILPLGMTSKVVLRTNLRNLIDMSHLRLCKRAYWEFNNLMKDIMEELRIVNDEWGYIIDNYFKPNCQYLGYCPEKKPCK